MHLQRDNVFIEYPLDSQRVQTQKYLLSRFSAELDVMTVIEMQCLLKLGCGCNDCKVARDSAW